jgi:hypothetical protein
MVSSVISRESEGKVGEGRSRSYNKLSIEGSKNKLHDEVVDEAYQLYSSRHPS